MAGELTDQEQIRRYLLREVSDEEDAQIETRLMTDDGYAEEISIVEDELVDEYLGGGLTSEQRARFEAAYLATPQGREHLNFAMAFQKYVSARSDGDSLPAGTDLRPRRLVTGWATASVALAMVLLALSLWLLLRIQRADRELDRVRSELADSRQQGQIADQQLTAERDNRLRLQEEAEHQKVSLESEIASLKKQGLSTPVGLSESVAAVLYPGTERGAGGKINELSLKPGASSIRIRLILPEGKKYNVYRATLKPNGGVEKTLPNGLKATGTGHSRGVVAELQAQSLDQGDYSLTLYGGEPGDKSTYVATYGFRLIKG
jgi:hypothetical protein